VQQALAVRVSILHLYSASSICLFNPFSAYVFSVDPQPRLSGATMERPGPQRLIAYIGSDTLREADRVSTTVWWREVNSNWRTTLSAVSIIFSRHSDGTAGSNPALSATQSAHVTYILEKAETAREVRRSFRPQRTGESRLTPGSPDSASFLSVRNKNGSLQRPACALDGVRRTIVIPGDRQLHFDPSDLSVRE
jgi:hypothetical protein